MPMSLTIGWPEIALRLFCSALAGILIGLDRTRHGRAAGLRTMTLVALAACLSMIQANLLLNIRGKASDSFIVMDLMRLPLGILSGMGFIGAGAILRRDNFVVGVTTAAAMWFVTVVGLCFGGGQIGLGLVALALGLIVLAGLKVAEDRMSRDRLVSLSLLVEASGPTESEIRRLLAEAGFRVRSLSINWTSLSREMNFGLLWRVASEEQSAPAIVDSLARTPGVVSVRWAPSGT